MADTRQTGPFAVDITDGEWPDGSRDRLLRWRRYQPRIAGRTPRVLHSHGLGGSRESGADWLAHWASWGIAAVAVQHPGTDSDALVSASPLALRHLLRTAVDADQLAARQADLGFALDRLAEEAPGAPSALGLSGHSFGAVSALRLIGERRGRDDRPADPRVMAAVLFSPSARGGTLPLAERFAGVKLPCLHLTGSRDDGIGPGDISAADRRLPFEHMPPAHKHLLVLDGASHPDFAGQAAAPPPVAAHRTLLKAASTHFWLAHLSADDASRHWLRGTLPEMLAPADLYRHK